MMTSLSDSLNAPRAPLGATSDSGASGERESTDAMGEPATHEVVNAGKRLRQWALMEGMRDEAKGMRGV